MLSFPVSRWQQRNKMIAQFERSASLILPRLYVSDYRTASDSDVLKRLGITHIVSIIDFEPSGLPVWITAERKLHIHLSDRFDCQILPHLEVTTKFIKDVLAENQDNKVLVHCVQGISRSATVVCAYLMATKNMSAPASITFVQKQRSIVCPNIGFRKQLETYEKTLKEPGFVTHISRSVSAIVDGMRGLRATEAEVSTVSTSR